MKERTPKKIILTIISGMCLLLLAFTLQTGDVDFSAYDLINVVNMIRAANGVPPVQADALLMSVAQSHSEYQALTKRSSHADQSGGIVNNRVAASGYGQGRKFVAGENVAVLDLAVPNKIQIIAYEIWSDAGHLGAMINPKYFDAGVGIASDGDMVYVTLNLAGVVVDQEQPAPEITGTASPSETAVYNPGILPLVTVTANPDGLVIHTVGYGQTLSTIARIYDIDVNELAAMNDIDPNMIYEGQKIYIRKTTPGSPIVTPSLTAEPTISSTTQNPLPTLQPVVDLTATQNPEVTVTAPEMSRPREVGVVVVLVILSILIVIYIYLNNQLNR